MDSKQHRRPPFLCFNALDYSRLSRSLLVLRHFEYLSCSNCLFKKTTLLLNGTIEASFESQRLNYAVMFPTLSELSIISPCLHDFIIFILPPSTNTGGLCKRAWLQNNCNWETVWTKDELFWPWKLCWKFELSCFMAFLTEPHSISTAPFLGRRALYMSVIAFTVASMVVDGMLVIQWLIVLRRNERQSEQ